jgi:hypothetical protein
MDKDSADVLEALDFIKERMATKDDLKNFATRDDLKQFATKDDVREIIREDVPLIVREDVMRDDLFTALFQKNGVRYSVITLPEDEAWLTDILSTWRFTD